MQQHYRPDLIEPAVQQYWAENKVSKQSKIRLKKNITAFQCSLTHLVVLHMGHVRNYTIGDVVSRYQRMNGKMCYNQLVGMLLVCQRKVLRLKIKPHRQNGLTKTSKYMKKQLKMLGFGYDWDREIATCRPEYYKWEQWFFTELYKKGLVYKKNSTVNWCPNDVTVLANEQVHDGCCWRCDTPVEQKKSHSVH